jgi:hypothetical protein
MKEKRSTLNRIMMSAYMVVYLLLPGVLLIALHDTIEMPPGLNWTSWFAGLGLLLFLLGGFVLIYESFPRNTRRAVMLFVPVVLNHALYLIFHGTGALFRIMTVNASVSLSGLIFSIMAAALFHPWYDEEKQDNTGSAMLINSWEKKREYIKKNPGVLAGFAVLLLPVFSAVYFAVAGGLVTCAGQGVLCADTALYLFSLGNLALFNYRQFAEYFA